MLTLSALKRATRQMAAYGELRLPSVPRDRGAAPRSQAAPAPDPGPSTGQARVWDEEAGTFLLRDVGPGDAGPGDAGRS